MEQTSSFVQHKPFQLCLLRKEFQLDKLLQNDGEEDAGTERRRKNSGKIEIYSDELVFTCSDKFTIRNMSGCIQKSGDTHSYGNQDEINLENRRSVEFSCAAARCIPWRVDGHSNGETCRNTKNQEMWTFPNQKPGVKKRQWRETHGLETATVKPNASSESDHSENLKAERTEWPHVSRYSSSHGSSHLDRQEIYGPEVDDLVDDLDLNMANLEHISEFTIRVEQLFNETGKLTSEQTEVTGVNTIDLQRTYVDVHKLIAQQSFSGHQR